MVAGVIFVAIACLGGQMCVWDSSVAAANDGVKVDAKLNNLFTDNMVLLRHCWAE